MKINWRPWEKEIFAKAIKENKPILLDISATWCHWCHVMDEKTYQDDGVVKFIEENFVPVRVDTDERPDINARYNQGGWPTTVFLTPLGEIITGGTYTDPDELVELAEKVYEIYHRLAGPVGSNPIISRETKGSTLNDATAGEKRVYFIKHREIFLKKFEQILLDSFDPVYGGFGLRGPKFPHVEALDYCLVKYQRDGDYRFRQILTKSLEGLSEHGLFDHLEGGFFRYATDSAWQVPHFEKMLLDNARLACLYFDSYRFLGDRSFLEVSRKTINFIRNWLYDPDEGGFYAAVAADEEYYQLVSRGERLAFRKEKEKPAVDEMIYADLNGRSSFCLASIGEAKMSKKSFRRILKEHKSPGGLFYHFVKSGRGFWSDLLIDQIAVAKAWLQHPDAATAGAGSRSGGRSGSDNGGLPGSIRGINDGEAVTISKFWSIVMENFYDWEEGGFFDRVPTVDEDFGLLRRPLKPLAENVEAICILKELGRAEEARKSLIEIFWLYPKPALQSGSLARILLDA